MKDTRFIHFNATPLQQQVENRHQKTQSHLKIVPYPMLHLLALTHSRHQRKHALDHHPHIPSAALADFHILRVAIFAMKSRVRTDDHSSCKRFQQRMELRVRDIGCRRLPTADRPPLIQHHTEFAADDPARIRLALLANSPTLRETQFPDRMTELNAERIGDPQDGGLSQKSSGPVLVRVEEAKQAGALRQMRKQRQVIAPEPAIEMSGGGAFESKEQGERNDLAGVEFGLWVFAKVLHLLINAAEKVYK